MKNSLKVSSLYIQTPQMFNIFPKEEKKAVVINSDHALLQNIVDYCFHLLYFPEFLSTADCLRCSTSEFEILHDNGFLLLFAGYEDSKQLITSIPNY